MSDTGAAPISVLLVTPHPAQRDGFVATATERESLIVEVAYSPETAVARAGAGTHGVAVVDWATQPATAVVDLIGRLRERLPVLLLADAWRDAHLLALRAGADDLLTREHLTGELVELIVRRTVHGGRAAARLAEREQRLAALVHAALDGIVCLDAQFRIVDFNAAAERMFGRPASEVMGQPLDLLLPVRFRRNHHGLVQAFAQSGQSGRRMDHRSAVAGLHASGAEFPMEASISQFTVGDARLYMASIRDISDRAAVERELHHTGRLLVAAEQVARVGAYRFDPVSQRLSGSPMLRELLGEPDREHVALDEWLARIHPDDRASLAAQFLRCAAADGSIDCECRLQPPPGAEERWLHVLGRSGAPSDAGSPAVIGTIQDISDRKREEQRWRASEMRLRLALEAGRMGAWDWSVATGRTIWTDTLHELLDIDPTAGASTELFLERVAGDDMARVQETIRRATAEGVTFDMEYRIRRRDGTSRRLRSLGRPVRHPTDGGVERLVGVTFDVTEQREAEAALRVRGSALEAAAQGILITDAGRPDDPIVYANPAFERMTGYTAGEVRGRNPRFLQGSGTDPQPVALLRQAVREQRPCHVELLNYRKDGTPFWSAVYITPVRNEAGSVSHFVGLQLDMTDRRALETALHRSQRMEAIGQLAGGVAHDFNNLLTVINITADLLLQRPDLPAAARESVAEVQAAGQRAATLTRQLLAFSRKQMLVPQDIDLNAVVAGVIGMLRRLIGDDVALDRVPADDLPLVFADPGQIEQVIVNLAVNARDAMPGGGRLTIETRDLRLEDALTGLPDACPPGRYAALIVSDTGVGMPEAVKARLFEPFFTTKAPGKGTGLGLASIFGIVKQTGGYLQVESTPGAGSRFSIFLPAASAGAAREHTTFGAL